MTTEEIRASLRGLRDYVSDHASESIDAALARLEWAEEAAKAMKWYLGIDYPVRPRAGFGELLKEWEAMQTPPRTEIADCGCVVTRGWRCLMHSQP